MSAFALGAYLRDHAAQAAVGAACIAGVSGMLAVLGAGWQAAVLAAAFMALCFAVMLAIGFARRARFYRELAGLSAQKAGPGNLASLLEEPDFLEGRLAWRALDEQGRAAADEITGHKQQNKEYRDYVEDRKSVV